MALLALVPMPPGPRPPAMSENRPTRVDLPSFTTIYRDNAPLVARWAARLGGPDVEVEDVLQEVFVIAHRQLPSFRGDSLLSTWLFAITRNVVRHRLQRERVRRFFLAGVRIDSQLDGPQPTAVDEIERRESLELVYHALSGLPERHRTAFVLFEIEGLTGEQASALTGTKVSTLRVWLLRARAEFSARMKRMENTLDVRHGAQQGGRHA